MSYTLQFGQIWPYLPSLLAGAWLSLQIAFIAFCGGLLIGTAGAAVLSFGAGICDALFADTSHSSQTRHSLCRSTFSTSHFRTPASYSPPIPPFSLA